MARPKLKDVVQIHQSVREALNPSTLRTTEESRAFGKNLRQRLPIEDQGIWEAAENRPDPIDLLRSQGAQRVQSLLPIRYQRMSASPFAFYRGGALIMAQDLSDLPSTGLTVQLCGDAHVANFGLFASPERRTVFDINDFDETLPGPWEWDIKRLAASIEICGRTVGFSKGERKDAVKACARRYRQAMREFAEMGNLEVWYAHLDVDHLMQMYSENLTDLDTKAAKKLLKKAQGKDSARAIRKLTEVVDGNLRFISNPPLIVPMRDLIYEDLAQKAGADAAATFTRAFDNQAIEFRMSVILAQYLKSLAPDKRHLIGSYIPVDMARKVVGVGSVGTRAWVIVLKGADEHDPLVLQVKEAQESVLERFVGKSTYAQSGKRVVEGQRAMQTASDVLLGWCRVPDVEGSLKDYYVRQLWDGKGSFNLDVVTPKQLCHIAEACGWTLAHAHARTGNRFALASYLGETGEFEKAIAHFARAYAKQNEADYQRFLTALDEGQLPTA